MLDKIKVREVANNYANAVIQSYNPKQIILFGSYVNGTPHEDSDIDIAVIFDCVEGDFLDRWSKLIRLCRGISYDIEVHLQDETMTRCGFLDHIRNTGEVIFESAISD